MLHCFLWSIFASCSLRLVSLVASKFLPKFGCHVQRQKGEASFLGLFWNKETFLGLLSSRCPLLPHTGCMPVLDQSVIEKMELLPRAVGCLVHAYIRQVYLHMGLGSCLEQSHREKLQQ